jgi:hypothetical protein
MLRRTTALEQKWLVRVILKGPYSTTVRFGTFRPSDLGCSCYVDDAELKMGSSEKTILNYFHPDAVELFNITSNLRRVCHELKDPTTTLSARVTPSLAATHRSDTRQ